MLHRKFFPFLCTLISIVPLMAQEKAFLGKWDITGTKGSEKYIYWLEVKKEDGKLAGNFLNRGGSVEPLPEISVEKGELIFSPITRNGNPKPVHRAKVANGKLVGTMTVGSEAVRWVGVRPPKWGTYNASGDHKFGAPVGLFDGTTMKGWKLQSPDKPSGWSVENGATTNSLHANNIVSEKKFKDFRVHVEYKLESNSNSGIYLRGRYELQVLDDAGKPTESHGHGAIYSRVPPLVNASKPPEEWQTMEATIVGNRVTAFLNGQKIHDNAVVEGITGGALDADEGAPGPIMIQGDHGKIWVRKVTVTPIVK